MRRRLAILATLTVTAVVTPATAGADPQPPDEWAAAAQYVEMIPTSAGPRPSGSGGRTAQPSKALEQQLRRSGGADAQALQTLVTASGWGAVASSARGEAAPIEKAPASSEKAPASSADAPPDRVAAGPGLAVPPPSESESLAGAAGGAIASDWRGVLVLATIVALVAGLGLRLRRAAP